MTNQDRVWPQCTEPECENPAKRTPRGGSRKRCSKHEKQRETAKNSKKECYVQGCDLPRHQARRYCTAHTRRMNRYGDVMAHVPLGRALHTHCRRGHLLDQGNTYIQPSTGARHCRICRRDRQRKRAAAQRAAKRAVA